MRQTIKIPASGRSLSKKPWRLRPSIRWRQLDHFCDVIAGRAAPIITAADALQNLRTMETVRRSIATGQTVALQDLR